MITDSIQNARLYYGLGPGVAAALKYFAEYDATKHDITPVELTPAITVRRFSYTTAPSNGAKLEAHRDYIDVMLVAEGEEGFYYKPFSLCENPSPYDPAIDASLADIDADAAFVPFRAGYFAIFMPQDAHCAGQLYNDPAKVKRLVAKVPVQD